MLILLDNIDFFLFFNNFTIDILNFAFNIFVVFIDFRLKWTLVLLVLQYFFFSLFQFLLFVVTIYQFVQITRLSYYFRYLINIRLKRILLIILFFHLLLICISFQLFLCWNSIYFLMKIFILTGCFYYELRRLISFWLEGAILSLIF